MRKFRLDIRIEKHQNKIIKFTDSSLKDNGAMIIGKRKLKVTKEREREWKQFHENDQLTAAILEKWSQHWKKIKPHHEIDLDMDDKITVKVVKKSDSTVVNEQSYRIRSDNTDKLLKFTFQ